MMASRLRQLGLALGVFGLFMAESSSASAQAPYGPTPPGRIERLLRQPFEQCNLPRYPFFERRYVKDICTPSIVPGSCFGYYKTHWTPWEVACPNWETCHQSLIGPGVPIGAPAVHTAPEVPPIANTPTPAMQSKPAPVPLAPKPSPVNPAIPEPTVPGKPLTEPGKGSGGISLPAIPTVPAQRPVRF